MRPGKKETKGSACRQPGGMTRIEKLTSEERPFARTGTRKLEVSEATAQRKLLAPRGHFLPEPCFYDLIGSVSNECGFDLLARRRQITHAPTPGIAPGQCPDVHALGCPGNICDARHD
jgi:hypothetical protein